MTGKAEIRKTPEKKNLGLNRRVNTNYTANRVNFKNSGVGTSTNSLNTAGLLKTAGDTMMGPIAFSRKNVNIISNSINIDNDTDDYSSYVIAAEPSFISPINLNTITGAAFNGQLLLLESIAGQTIVLKHGVGNIVIPDLADFNITSSSVAILIFDPSWTPDGKWVLVSTFVRPSVGGWVGSATSDLDMNTYDIIDVDRLKFGTTQNINTPLTSTDTGIEALYSGASPFGMKIQIPSTNSAVFIIQRGVTPYVNISSLGTTFDTNVFFGSTIGTSINPTTNNSFDLGTSSVRWRDIYLSGKLTTNYVEVDSSSTTAGFRDLGHPADPSTSAAGEIYYNTTSNVFKFYNGTSWTTMSGGWVGNATTVLDMNNNAIQEVDYITFDVTSGTAPKIQSSSTGDVLNILTHGVNRVNISRTSAGQGVLEIFGTNGTVGQADSEIKLVSTSTANTSGVVGEVVFDGKNSAGTQVSYGSIYCQTSDVISPEHGTITISPRIAGSLSPRMSVSDDINMYGKLVLFDGMSVSIGDIDIDSAKIKAANSTDIGIQVTNAIITTGTMGTMQIPYLVFGGIPTNSQLDVRFGNANGCIGLQRDTTNSSNKFWARINGVWVGNFLI